MSNVAESRFARAMGGHRFGAAKAMPVASAPPPAPPPPAAIVTRPDPPGLLLGALEDGGGVALDLPQLLTGRLLIQGVSGAGKSWLLRRICEQAAGAVQLIVIDPEGEFSSLAELLEIPHVAGHLLSAESTRELATRARSHRLSLVLDLSELDRHGQMEVVAAMLETLLEAPREHWHPCIVAIDEAHLFAPFGGHSGSADTAVRKAAIGAVVDLMARGRKRGLAAVLATQRLARLAKSVASEVQNVLVGHNTLDLDIKRAAEQIGWSTAKAADRLPRLRPGEFVAVGRAFSAQPAQLKVGAVRSPHLGAAPKAEAPAWPEVDEAKKLLDLERLSAAGRGAGEDETEGGPPAAAPPDPVRDFLLHPAFATAARLAIELRRLAPDGARTADLAAHLEVEPGALDSAVALLDQYGAIEFGEVEGTVALAPAFAAVQP